MRLCIYGIESLESLEAAVTRSFGEVKGTEAPLDFGHHGMPLKNEVGHVFRCVKLISTVLET